VGFQLLKKRTLSWVVLFIFGASISSAGTWTVDRNVAGDSVPALLQTEGTTVKASNLGGGGAVTVGGVDFDADTSNVTAPDTATTAYYTGTDADLTALLNTQARTYSTTTSATISFTGLTVGAVYRMQMVTGWAWGWLKYRLTGAQGETVNLNWAQGDDDPGINIATYTWTADASSATFEFISTQTSGEWKPAEVMAYSLYQLNPYEIHSTKKGVGSAGGDALNKARIEALGASWYYNWGMNQNLSVNSAIEYVPMKHTKWWPVDGDESSYLDDCINISHLLAYNEPEHQLPDPSKPTVAEALAYWPTLESLAASYGGLQLGSAACAGGGKWWQDDFMAGAAGLQVDFMAIHRYPAPTNFSALLNDAQTYHNDFGNRDIWVTEFNAADWIAPNDYTHEQSYTWMAEMLYRLESTSYIKRYAVFPWDANWDPEAAASHIFEGYGTAVLTPLGKLYAAYRSADVNGPYTQVWYHLHNKDSDRRLDVNAGTPAVADVYSEDSWTVFEWVDAGGDHYIDNTATGYRLKCTGTALAWGTSADTGGDVKWRLVDAGNGWDYIQNDTYGKRLASNGTSLMVVNSSQTNDTLRWVFIRSMNEFDPTPDTDPPTPDPATFQNTPGEVSNTAISMTATTGTDVSGIVEYLFTETTGNPGATSSVWQTSPVYTDTGLSPETQYTYTVTMRDALGNIGTASDPASASTGTASEYQAEDYTSQSGTCLIESFHAGYTGTAYVNIGGNGSWFEWNYVEGGSGGSYNLTFRYASVDTANRQCEISVNGTPAGNVSFAPTGFWTTWLTELIAVTLQPGLNTVRIMSNTSEGGPNVDKMTVDLPGDLTGDERVDLEDMAELGFLWQTGYDMDTLQDIADNWLYGISP